MEDEIFLKTSVDSDANATARQMTIAKYGSQATKVKIGRAEFSDIIKSVYLLAQTNAVKDVRQALKKYNHNDFVNEVIGICDIAIVNSHNALATKTKYGRRTFNPMTLENLCYEHDFKVLCRKPNVARVVI